MILKLCVGALIFSAGAAVANTTVLRTSPVLDREFQELVRIFKTRGTTAVADYLNTQMEAEDRLVSWQEFAQLANDPANANKKPANDNQAYTGPHLHELEIEIHPNEAKAVAWINKRFRRMGLPHLQFKIKSASEDKVDPTAIDEEALKPFWWARLLGSPGLAVAAFIAGLPHVPGTTAHDYLIMMIPAATVGILTIVTEITFVVPKFNQQWKKLWKLGGPNWGRVWNFGWNFTFGMMLYYANAKGVDLVHHLGGHAADAPALLQAVVTAIKGAAIFSASLGQFAVDIATEEERGSIDANTRYELETPGSVIVNGVRVATWMLAPTYMWINYVVQTTYIGMKTLPQLLKTNFANLMQDREMFRRLNPTYAPKEKVWEKCAQVLSRVRILNLPQMVKATR